MRIMFLKFFREKNVIWEFYIYLYCYLSIKLRIEMFEYV